MRHRNGTLSAALLRRLVWLGVAALAAAWWPPGAAAWVRAAAPAVTLTPDRGPCDARPLLRGGGFPAGATVDLVVAYPAPRPPGGGGVQVGVVTADAAGAFAVAVPLPCGPDEPPGTEFRVAARARPDGPGAAATFTVDYPLADRCFPETGHCARGRFLAYWLGHGGLALNGYPLSDEFAQRLEDGREYTVQYFERVRLELHPENPPPYDVLLGQFGRRILAGVPDAPTAPVPPRVGGATIYFPQTGHNVGRRFADYWAINGGLAQFGYPLSELFEERLEDGRVYAVQYFERARFEHHPENPPPDDVLLGQFGRRILAETTGR